MLLVLRLVLRQQLQAGAHSLPPQHPPLVLPSLLLSLGNQRTKLVSSSMRSSLAFWRFQCLVPGLALQCLAHDSLLCPSPCVGSPRICASPCVCLL